MSKAESALTPLKNLSSQGKSQLVTILWKYLTWPPRKRRLSSTALTTMCQSFTTSIIKLYPKSRKLLTRQHSPTFSRAWPRTTAQLGTCQILVFPSATRGQSCQGSRPDRSWIAERRAGLCWGSMIVLGSWTLTLFNLLSNNNRINRIIVQSFAEINK